SVGGADEDRALRRLEADPIARDREPGGRKRSSPEPRLHPAEEAREGGVRDGERAGRIERGGRDGCVAAADLDEDRDEDAEGDRELQEEAERALHGNRPGDRRG